MRKVFFSTVAVAVCLIAARAQVPIREFDVANVTDGGGTPSQPVAVVNFPTDDAGSILVSSPQRIFEEFLLLDPADATCIAPNGFKYWRLPTPPGGPWHTLTYHFLSITSVSLSFGVAEWDSQDATPESPNCSSYCSCGLIGSLIPVPGSSPPTGFAGNVLALGNQVIVSSNTNHVQALYLKWQR